MTVRHYVSTDAGAPALSGTVSSMIALLDAVLVNGYGTQAAAGWTKEFIGTNIAAYRAFPTGPGATGMYLLVDDTNATYSIVKAYKTMSDISTGTDVIPSGNPAYTNTAVYWIKSSTSNLTARPWSIIADNRTFYMNVSPNGSVPASPANSFIFGAGDFESYVPGNVYNYFIIGTYNTTASNSTIQVTNGQSTYGVALIGRAQDMVSTKQSKFWVPFLSHATAESSGSSTTFPDSSYTNLKFFYPAVMVESAVQPNITGRLRGVYGYAGRATTTWLANFGNLPDDLGGPELIQFLASTSSGSSLYVLNGGW